MMITDLVNGIAEGLTGFVTAGAALSASIALWLAFWTRTAKLIPTEFKNPYLRTIFTVMNLFCRCLGLDVSDIAKIQLRPFRIVTRQELMASQVVNAAVVPEAVKENPPAPAISPQILSENTNV